MTIGEKVTLRPVTESDDEFLLSAYASTREEELSRVPWSKEQKEAFVRMQFTAQKQHYAAEYPRASHGIILLEGVPAGRLYLDRGPEKFHILDITVLPQYRKRGTGSQVLRGVMEEAAREGKPVTIYVETFNPSLSLFGKLGFQRVSVDGLNALLRWTPGIDGPADTR